LGCGDNSCFNYYCGLGSLFFGSKNGKNLQTVLIEPAVKNWNSVSDLPAKNNIEFCDNVFGFHKNSQR